MTYTIKQNQDRFGAFVIQTTATAAGAEENVIACKWFWTEKGARSWLKRREAE